MPLSFLNSLKALKKSLETHEISASDYSSYHLSDGYPEVPTELGLRTLVIKTKFDESAVAFGLKYHPHYLEQNKVAVETRISELSNKLAAITQKPIEIDSEYSKPLEALWVLENTLKFSDVSPDNKKIISQLGDIEISNHNDAEFIYRTYSAEGKIIYENIEDLTSDIFKTKISSTSFNQKDFYAFLNSVPNLQKRQLQIVERLKVFKQKNKIPNVKYYSVITDIEMTEKIVQILEEEANRPDNKFSRVDSLSVVAGSSLSKYGDRLVMVLNTTDSGIEDTHNLLDQLRKLP